MLASRVGRHRLELVVAVCAVAALVTVAASTAHDDADLRPQLELAPRDRLARRTDRELARLAQGDLRRRHRQRPAARRPRPARPRPRPVRGPPLRRHDPDGARRAGAARQPRAGRRALRGPRPARHAVATAPRGARDEPRRHGDGRAATTPCSIASRTTRTGSATTSPRPSAASARARSTLTRASFSACSSSSPRWASWAGGAFPSGSCASASRPLARTDPLTDLANHRHFHERLRAELDRAGRDGTNLALVVLDLDHFAGLNDRRGHRFGDRVLSESPSRRRRRPRQRPRRARRAAGASP